MLSGPQNSRPCLGCGLAITLEAGITMLSLASARQNSWAVGLRVSNTVQDKHKGEQIQVCPGPFRCTSAIANTSVYVTFNNELEVDDES